MADFNSRMRAGKKVDKGKEKKWKINDLFLTSNSMFYFGFFEKIRDRIKKKNDFQVAFIFVER